MPQYLNFDDVLAITSESDKPAISRMLKRFKGRLLYIQTAQLDTRERTEVFSKLIASGESIKTAKKIIMQRFGICQKSARRIANLYLDQKAKQATAEKAGKKQ